MSLALNIILALAAVASTVVAYLEYRGKQAERDRADKAELAQERMAQELAEARRELAGSRVAHEEIATIERAAADNDRRAARDALSLQKKQAKDTQKASSAALREQKRQASREERARKAQDKKVLAEATKQRKAAEKLAREARRKKK